MPTSKKQIAANRRNAKKSTGPKTTHGKAVSSMNAVKHGLYSKELIIKSPAFKEDPRRYRRLYCRLARDLNPEGELECHLVHQMADAIWRSHRIMQAEKKAFSGERIDFAAVAAISGHEHKYTKQLSFAHDRLIRHQKMRRIISSGAISDANPELRDSAIARLYCLFMEETKHKIKNKETNPSKIPVTL